MACPFAKIHTRHGPILPIHLFCINGFIVRDRTLSGEEKVYFLPECNEGRKRILIFFWYS
jgi:hypothetical protein